MSCPCIGPQRSPVTTTCPPLELSSPRGKYNSCSSDGLPSWGQPKPKQVGALLAGIADSLRGLTKHTIDAGVQSPSEHGTVSEPSGSKPRPSGLRKPVASTSTRLP